MDLPALLGVDLVHCERQAAAAVAAGGGALQAVQGELITQGYFDNLAAEIDELLQVRPGRRARGFAVRSTQVWVSLTCCPQRCAGETLRSGAKGGLVERGPAS